MFPRLLVFTFLLPLPVLAARQDDEPALDGKKASEWVDMLINDASARKRALAIDALAKLWATKQYKDSLPTIGRALRLDSSVAVRTRAATALAGLKEEDVKFAVRDLTDALGKEKESRVRREIAVALGRVPSAAKLAIVPLTAALKDPDAATRAAAADALAQTGPDGKAAAEGLVPHLQDADKGVRRAVVIALGRISPEGAATIADTMARMLGSETDLELKAELVTSLGLLGEKSAAVVAALARELSVPDDELRRKAVRTLGTFGLSSAPAADALLKTATGDKLKDIRADAVHAIGSALGPDLKTRTKELIPLLMDPEFEVRLAVVDELGAIGPDLKADEASMKALRQRLSDPNIKVREAAAAAVKRIEKKPEPKKGE